MFIFIKLKSSTFTVTEVVMEATTKIIKKNDKKKKFFGKLRNE